VLIRNKVDQKYKCWSVGTYQRPAW